MATKAVKAVSAVPQKENATTPASSSKDKKDKKLPRKFDEMYTVAFKFMNGRVPGPLDNRSSEFEQMGCIYYYLLQQHIERSEGIFIRDDGTEQFSVQIGNTCVPLSAEVAKTSAVQARFVKEAIGVSNLSREVQVALSHLRIFASERASSHKKRRFSATCKDGSRVYVYLKNGKVLLIDSDKFTVLDNGKNEDKFWLEFPPTDDGDGAFEWAECDPRPGLEQFERLIVDTSSACPANRWLCAMAESVLPFIREYLPTRALCCHIGASGHGKTSAMERHSHLLGIGKALGDISVPAIRNGGDRGLLCLDETENNQINESLIKKLLTLATGAKDERSSQDGLHVRSYLERPIVVMASETGAAVRGALANRMVEIEHELAPGATPIDIQKNLSDIVARRHQILCALMHVIREWIGLREESYWKDNTRTHLVGYFRVMAQLLTAYENTAGKPEGWALAIYTQWENTSSGASEHFEDILEQPILKIFTRQQEPSVTFQTIDSNYSYKDMVGSLFAVSPGELHFALMNTFKGLRDYPCKTSSALSLHLASRRYNSFRVVKACECSLGAHDPARCHGVPEIRRTQYGRMIGIFVPVDGAQPSDPVYDERLITELLNRATN